MVFPTIHANRERLNGRLDKLAGFSDAPSPAVTRVLFTPTELAARAYIRQLMREGELQIREDGAGNIFGQWTGSEPDLPPVTTGSHIDAIPFSGRYDGTVGVIGALEAIQILKDGEFSPRRSLVIIMFSTEEPTRFGLGCLGSRALSGQIDENGMRALQDKEGRGFDEVRREAGYTEDLSSVQVDPGTYHSFVELHIEQGTHLEEVKAPIGLVTAIAAPATLRITLFGEGGHAGAVLMRNRRDALAAASEIVLAVEKAAASTGRKDSVATAGLLQVYPNAVNSIPSRVMIEIDVRDTSLSPRDGMVAYIKATINAICSRRQIRSEIEILNADPPSEAGELPLKVGMEVCKHLLLPYELMISRAYHDTLFMSLICPTTMIFVPSKGGYSHRPEEFTSAEEIARGVEVLALTLAKLSGS